MSNESSGVTRLMATLRKHQERPYRAGDWVCSCGSFGASTHEDHLAEVITKEFTVLDRAQAQTDNRVIPTLEQVDELIDVTSYLYMGGVDPKMSEFAKAWTDGDGGLLKTLNALRTLLSTQRE